MPAMIAILVLVLAIPVLAVATVAAGRREKPPPDPTHWKREPAEPWGSILLVLFFISPVLQQVARWLDFTLLWPLTIVGAGALLVHITGGLSGMRELIVGDEAIEVRAGRRREEIPLRDVMSVTGFGGFTPLRVHLADGRSVELPGGPHGEAIGGSIAERIGQTWRSWCDVQDAPGVPDSPFARFRRGGLITIVSFEEQRALYIPAELVNPDFPILGRLPERGWLDGERDLEALRKELDLLLERADVHHRAIIEEAADLIDHVPKDQWASIAVLRGEDAGG